MKCEQEITADQIRVTLQLGRREQHPRVQEEYGLFSIMIEREVPVTDLRVGDVFRVSGKDLWAYHAKRDIRLVSIDGHNCYTFFDGTRHKEGKLIFTIGHADPESKVMLLRRPEWSSSFSQLYPVGEREWLYLLPAEIRLRYEALHPIPCKG